MAEDTSVYTIKEDELGEVQISDEVVARIAALAAVEVEGVSSVAGNITKELIYKLAFKNLAKGVKVIVKDGSVTVNIALNIVYEYSVPAISEKVQEKVKAAIENMTGLTVNEVNVKISAVDMDADLEKEKQK